MERAVRAVHAGQAGSGSAVRAQRQQDGDGLGRGLLGRRECEVRGEVRDEGCEVRREDGVLVWMDDEVGWWLRRHHRFMSWRYGYRVCWCQDVIHVYELEV